MNRKEKKLEERRLEEKKRRLLARTLRSLGFRRKVTSSKIKIDDFEYTVTLASAGEHAWKFDDHSVEAHNCEEALIIEKWPKGEILCLPTSTQAFGLAKRRIQRACRRVEREAEDRREARRRMGGWIPPALPCM